MIVIRLAKSLLTKFSLDIFVKPKDDDKNDKKFSLT